MPSLYIAPVSLETNTIMSAPKRVARDVARGEAAIENTSARDRVLHDSHVMTLIAAHFMIGDGAMFNLSQTSKQIRAAVRAAAPPKIYAVTPRSIACALGSVPPSLRDASNADFKSALTTAMWNDLASVSARGERNLGELALRPPSKYRSPAELELVLLGAPGRVVVDTVFASFTDSQYLTKTRDRGTLIYDHDAYNIILSILWSRQFKYVWDDDGVNFRGGHKRHPRVLHVDETGYCGELLLQWHSINSPAVQIHAPCRVVVQPDRILDWVLKWADFAEIFKTTEFTLTLCTYIHMVSFLTEVLYVVFDSSWTGTPDRPYQLHLNIHSMYVRQLYVYDPDDMEQEYSFMLSKLVAQHTQWTEIKTLNMSMYAPVYTTGGFGDWQTPPSGPGPARHIYETLEHVMVWGVQTDWNAFLDDVPSVRPETVDSWLLDLVTTLHALKTIELAPKGEQVDASVYPKFVAYCKRHGIAIVGGVGV